MMKKWVYRIFTPGGVCCAGLPGAILFRPCGASGFRQILLWTSTFFLHTRDLNTDFFRGKTYRKVLPFFKRGVF
jgi:hypothetical protein